MTLRLALRRARRDLAVILVWIVLLAFAVLLAIEGPLLQRNTVDAGARQAVAAAGSSTDVLVGGHVGLDTNAVVEPIRANQLLSLAAHIPGRLPAAIHSVYAGSELSVIGPATRLVSSTPATTVNRPIDLELALLTPQNSRAISYSQGAAPSSASGISAVPIVISAATAAASGLGLGSIAEVSTNAVGSGDTGSNTIALRVVGIAARTTTSSSDSSPWRDLGRVWTPSIPKSTAQSVPIEVAALTNVAGLQFAASQYPDTFTATLRIRLDPHKFTDALESRIGTDIAALAIDSSRLNGSTPGQLSVSSDYTPALAGYPPRAAAATAQISMLAAGILGSAAALIVLVSNLLVMRRSADTALERARGASLWSIGARSLADSVVFTAIGLAIGWCVAVALHSARVVQPVLVLAVVVVALVSLPVQSVLIARPVWAGRRVPANRADRLEIERGVRARRIAFELTLVLLGVAALVALLARGLLESHTDGVDPLLASAPLFVAIVVTIVVLRIYRWPLLLAASVGRRSTGALGLLAAVRAQRSIAVLPLLALTISVALAVGAGLLAGTVSSGQTEASWQRIGADVRVDVPTTQTQLADVERAPGVTVATSYFARTGIQLRLGTGTAFATVLGVGRGFGRFLQDAPANGLDGSGAANLDKLTSASSSASSGAPLPVVVDATIAKQFSGTDTGMYYGDAFIPIHVIGTVDDVQRGYLDAPLIYANSAALAARVGHPLVPTAVLIDGPGAAAAAASLHADASKVHSRAAWLKTLQGHAEVSGVVEAITASMIVAAILAALALAVTVLGGARERGRSLALVRTLGLPASAGNWLSLAELAPVMVASLVGGVAAGVGMVALLEPVIGLVALTGGLDSPRPTFSAAVIVALVAGAIVLLVIATAIEFSIRRRDRLSEVLRVGETA